MGNLKKEKSVEDLLKQQIEKQEYFDGGDGGGDRPGGGGGGGDDASGGAEDEGIPGILDELGQVVLATMGFICLVLLLSLSLSPPLQILSADMCVLLELTVYIP